MSTNPERPKPDYRLAPDSKLGMVLSGLDLEFALSELAARQGDRISNKEMAQRFVEERYGLLDGNQKTRKMAAARLGIRLSSATDLEKRALHIFDRVRGENRPERVFDRPDIRGIDDAFLIHPDVLKRMGRIAAPKFKYPSQL